MILIDTGPLVALFDLRDRHHEGCVDALKTFDEPIRTTLPVLTEAFHMLRPESHGSNRLRDFIANGDLGVWFFDRSSLLRALEVMEQYADHPMDLADASLIVAAEVLRTRKVFTVDRRDFPTYRIRRGHRYYPLEILP